MKKQIAALLAGIMTLSVLSACDGSNQVNEEVTPYPIIVGNVTIEKKPRAVASLSPSLTKMLLDLGYQSEVVGYSEEDTLPEGVVLSDLTEQLAAASPPAPEGEDAAPPEDGDPVEPSSTEGGDVTAAALSAGGGDASADVSADVSAPVESAVSEEPTPSTDSSEQGEAAPESGESSDPLMTSSLAAYLETWDGKSPIPREPVLYGTVGTAMNPDLVKIGILKPEILFTTLPLTRAQMDKLDDVNIKVVVMPAVKSIGELEGRYLDLVRIMEGQLKSDTAGRAISEAIREQLDYIVSKVPATKKSFLYVCSLDPLVATGDTWESSVLSLLGTNLAESGTEYAVTEEELAGMDPDVIFYADPLTPEHFTENERFKEKKAVTGEALVKLDNAALMGQTREIIETVRALAAQLYPDADFTPPPPPSSDSGSGGADTLSSGGEPDTASEEVTPTE